MNSTAGRGENKMIGVKMKINKNFRRLISYLRWKNLVALQKLPFEWRFPHYDLAIIESSFDITDQ